MKNKEARILIVEDQKWTLKALENAVEKVIPKFYSSHTCDVAKSYNEVIGAMGNRYDLILLDHMMPIDNVGDLEDRDMYAFSETLRGIGYSLISVIYEVIGRDTVIIGTSSLDADELRNEEKPMYTMSKMWNEAEKDLERILTNIENLEERK